jgi:hypothetical protein
VLFSCKNNRTKLDTEQNVNQEVVLQSLNWLKSADPVNDAIQTIKNDSLYFIGVLGYATDIPGVDEYYSLYENKIPIKIINGTGDVIISDEMHELNYKARQYALQFNSVILYHLRK